MPARRERPGLRLAVADDAADEQVGVVERGAVGVHERVAELAALVDRAGRLRRRVARDAARERELAEQPAQALGVARDRRDRPRCRCPRGRCSRRRPGRRGPARRRRSRSRSRALIDAVHVRVDEVQPGRGAPVAEQARLDVLERQRLAQQRVVQEVDLPDRQVVGGAPVGVDQIEFRMIHVWVMSIAVEAGMRRLGALLAFVALLAAAPAYCGPARRPAARRRRATSTC